MALTITHAFVSGVADDPAAAAAGEVLPSEWDAAHVVGITGGIDQAILFDKAGVVGEDANLKWDYTNQALNITGATVTANHPVLQLSQTWNNAAVSFNGLEFDVTNTASSISSNIFNFTLGGTPVFYLDVSGPVGGNGNIALFLGVGIGGVGGGNDPFIGGYSVGGIHGTVFGSDAGTGFLATGKISGSPGFCIRSDGWLGWISGSFGPTPILDTAFARDATGVVALYNANSLTSPTGLRLYNTFIGGGNYERGVFDWTTTPNVLTIGTQANGSGALRAVQLVGASITAQNASLSVAADTGGIASTNTVSSANSTTISTGTGTVKMSSANNANNTGWLKCYIGTQVAWIPCWTTNAP